MTNASVHLELFLNAQYVPLNAAARYAHSVSGTQRSPTQDNKAAEIDPSYIIPRALLQLNQPPPSRIRIIHILGDPCDANRIGDLLDLIHHAGRQFIGLRIAIHMHLLGAARDNEHRDLARLQHPRGQDIHVADIQHAAVGFEARGQVLLGKSGVDLVLRGGEPEFEGFGVGFDVGVEDFGEDVFAHVAEEGLDGECGVHFFEFLDHLGGFVFGEEACYTVGDGAGGGHEGVFGLGVGGFEGEEGLH